jgi:hypothetical protein
MSWLRFFQRVYSLDTLDSRFVTSAITPPRASTNDIELSSAQGVLSGSQPNGSSKQLQRGRTRDGVSSDTKAPLWDTFEFYFYYFMFITVVPVIFYIPYTVSRRMLSHGESVRVCTNFSKHHIPATQPMSTYCLMDGFWGAKSYVESSQASGEI